MTGFVDPAGNLFIKGDSDADSIVVTQSAPGTYQVAGIVAPFTGVTRDINIDLKGGGDDVTIEAIETPRDLNIDLGEGGFARVLTTRVNGALNLKGVSTDIIDSPIAGNVRITGDAGPNSIYLFNTEINGAATINLLDGDDFGRIENSSIGRNLDVNLGAGDFDYLDILDTHVARDFLFDGGGGQFDQVSVLSSFNPEGRQVFVGGDLKAMNCTNVDVIGGAIARNLIFSGNSAENRLDIRDSLINGRVSFASGAGADTLYVERASINKSMSFDGDEGAEMVTIFDSNIGGTLDLNLGAAGDGGQQVGLFGVTVGANFGMSGEAIGTEINLCEIAGNASINSTSYLNAYIQTDIAGNLTITSGTGDSYIETNTSTVGGNLSISNGVGVNTNLVFNTAITRTLSIRGADGDEFVWLGNTTAQGATSLALGEGSNAVQITEGTQLHGHLHITNASYILMENAFVGGTTSIHTGSGNDLVQLLGTIVFNGAVNVQMGAGEDALEFFGPVTLAAPSNVFNGGSGADDLVGEENIEGEAKFISFP